MGNTELMDASLHTPLHRFTSERRGSKAPSGKLLSCLSSAWYLLQGLRNGSSFSLLASFTPVGVNNPQYIRELDCWQNITFAPFSLQL